MGGTGGMRERPGAWGHLGQTKPIRVAQVLGLSPLLGVGKEEALACSLRPCAGRAVDAGEQQPKNTALRWSLGSVKCWLNSRALGLCLIGGCVGGEWVVNFSNT